MGSDFAKSDFAFVEKPDQRRARNVQHVGGLLGGEFGVDGHDVDGIPLRHFLKSAHEQTRGAGRQAECFSGFAD